jgi:hypothetical protein
VNVLIGLLLTAAAAAATPAATSPAAPLERTAPVTAVEKVAVFLQTDARDDVGAAYVARLRQVLETSSSYRPVTNPASARFVVGIVTMDPNEAEAGSAAGHATVAAVTLQRENAADLNEFVYSWVLVARRDKVNVLATELYAAIDKEIRELEGATILLLDDGASLQE